MNAESALAERRMFPRLYISMYFEYQAQMFGGEEFWTDWAYMKDISLTGMHFLSDNRPNLNPGSIADFIFKFQPSEFNPMITNEIRATGMVKRVVAPTEESPRFGVVLEFLSGPIFKEGDY